jgi:hypothetical protein
LRQLGAGVEDEEDLERHVRPFRHAPQLGDDVRRYLFRDAQVSVDVGHDVRRVGAAQLSPCRPCGSPKLIARTAANVVADVSPGTTSLDQGNHAPLTLIRSTAAARIEGVA